MSTIPKDDGQHTLPPLVSPKEKRQAEFIRALRDQGVPVANELAKRLQRCLKAHIRQRVWRNQGWAVGDISIYDRCEKPACEWCRTRTTRNAKTRAHRRLGTIENEYASFVTVLLARTTDLTTVPEIVRKTRLQLRYLRDAAARKQELWGRVAATGYVEIDAIASSDIPFLPSERCKAVLAMPMHGSSPDADPVWLVHLHLVVRHEGIRRSELQKVLSRRYPGCRRVDIQELHQDKEAGENISNLIGYILKHSDCSTLRDGFEVTWPIDWKARYYTWLYSRNRGLQPLQVSLGPKRRKPG